MLYDCKLYIKCTSICNNFEMSFFLVSLLIYYLCLSKHKIFCNHTIIFTMYMLCMLAAVYVYLIKHFSLHNSQNNIDEKHKILGKQFLLLSQICEWPWAKLFISELSKLLGEDQNHSFLIWDSKDEHFFVKCAKLWKSSLLSLIHLLTKAVGGKKKKWMWP